MILVDSAVWIDLLNNRDSVPVSRLRVLLDMGESAVTPIIVQEVLQGAKDPGAFAKLRRYFAVMPLLGATDTLQLHVAAADLYARSRWRAITPRRPHDCLIAAVAITEDVPLLHDDRDFEQLAAVDSRLKLLRR